MLNTLLQKVTILVVDDSVLMLDYARSVLEKHGAAVSTAHTYSIARSLLIQGSPIDLLLTDVELGSESGYHLAKEAQTLRPDLPVLCMSGAPPANDLLPFLSKPFEPMELVAAICSALNLAIG